MGNGNGRAPRGFRIQGKPTHAQIQGALTQEVQRQRAIIVELEMFKKSALITLSAIIEKLGEPDADDGPWKTITCDADQMKAMTGREFNEFDLVDSVLTARMRQLTDEEVEAEEAKHRPKAIITPKAVVPPGVVKID